MPLESLNNEQINIHDLTIEQEKKPMPEWQEHYEEMKNSNIYDKENGQWKDFLNQDQVTTSDTRKTFDQLLSYLIESKLDKTKAKESHEKLKKTLLYNKPHKIWSRCLNEDQSVEDYDHETADQLLDIFFEVQFDKEKARGSYEKLKKTLMYNKKRDRWFPETDSFGNIVRDSADYIDDQLLGILVESQFDNTLAREHFETLKESMLFNEEKNQWNSTLHKKQGQWTKSVNRFSDNQLLGVLAEAQFDKAAAKNRYEALKNSPFYDKKLKQWNKEIYIFEERLSDPMRMTNAQLLGILCEQEFEEPELSSDTPPLPEERNY